MHQPPAELLEKVKQSQRTRKREIKMYKSMNNGNRFFPLSGWYSHKILSLCDIAIYLLLVEIAILMAFSLLVVAQEPIFLSENAKIVFLGLKKRLQQSSNCDPPNLQELISTIHQCVENLTRQGPHLKRREHVV